VGWLSSGCSMARVRDAQHARVVVVLFVAIIVALGFLTESATRGPAISRPSTQTAASSGNTSSIYPSWVNASVRAGAANTTDCNQYCYPPPSEFVPTPSSNGTRVDRTEASNERSNALLSAAPDACTGCHYYTGAIYNGSNFNSTNIYTTITTPSSGPRSGDLYYLLLSTWDSNGNYDQIGIASDYFTSGCPSGVACASGDYWEVFWEEYTPCGLYYWNPSAMSLWEYSNFTFQMELTGSHLVFHVYIGVGVGGTLLFTKSLTDSAAHFLVEKESSQCGGAAGFTVFQEVYDVSNSMEFPQWDFQFDGTYAGSSLISSWATLDYNVTTAPAWGYVVNFPHNAAASVQLANEPFEIRYPGDSATVAPNGTILPQAGYVGDIGSYCYDGFSQCYLNMSCHIPTGFNSLWTSWYLWVPSHPDYWQFSVNATTPAGNYFPGCTYTITVGSTYSTFLLYTTVT
jgi:hypothetical protein